MRRMVKINLNKAKRLAGRYARNPGRMPKQPVAKLEARVLNHILKYQPEDGSTH